MATTETARPEPARSTATTPPEPARSTATATPPGPARGTPAGLDPAAFRTGSGEDDRLIGQVAFARAIERGDPGASPEAVEALRAQALAELSEFAFRYLHNRIEEVRREAVASQFQQIGRPPSFLRLVLANLVALLLAAAAGSWLAGHPDLLAQLIWR
jgi:hypothetical protein